jgi:hypothetical protein
MIIPGLALLVDTRSVMLAMSHGDILQAAGIGLPFQISGGVTSALRSCAARSNSTLNYRSSVP